MPRPHRHYAKKYDVSFIPNHNLTPNAPLDKVPLAIFIIIHLHTYSPPNSLYSLQEDWSSESHQTDFVPPRLFTAWVKFTPPYRDGSQYQPRKREQKCDRNHPLEDKWLYRYICFLQSIYFRYQRLDRRCQFPIWSGHLLRPIQFACYLGKAKCLLCRYE